jgi:hypothetical protein
MMRPRLSSDKLTHLINSALFVDSVMGHGFRNVADLTPEERERGERWRRWRDGAPRLADLKLRCALPRPSRR